MHTWAELCVRGAGGQPGLLWEKMLTGAPCLSLGGLLLHSSALTYNRALNLHLLSAVLALPKQSAQMETRFKCKTVLREGLGEDPIGRLDLSLVASGQGRLL